jgi:L-asparaginase II
MLPRSALKPLQAAAMIDAGLELADELVALAASSHSGEPFQVEGVLRILAGAGLTESALGCTPDLPLDATARNAIIRAGGQAAPITMNCSGKHAAMLATCVVNGWETGGYLDPAHPLQQAIRTWVEAAVGERACAVGVDGCGAPLFGFSLEALARGFGLLVTSAAGSPPDTVAAAMRGHPDWVGGSDRDVTRLMISVPGLVAKDGAEGVFAAATAGGSVAVVKIGDGGARASAVVMASLLAALAVPRDQLTDLATVPVLGHGEPVGEIRAASCAGRPAPSSPGPELPSAYT